MLERWGYSTKLLCLVVWGLPSAMVSSGHKLHSPEREIKPSEDGVQLPTWQGNWKRSHTHSARPVQYLLVCVRVWVHIPGDPQSVWLRNATTTSTSTTTTTIVIGGGGCGFRW